MLYNDQIVYKQSLISGFKTKNTLDSSNICLNDGLNYDLDVATTLEGQVVAIWDEIAQRTHDLDDGVRAGLTELEQILELEIIKTIERKYEVGNYYFLSN